MPLTSWEHKPVVVLALELTWPTLAALDAPHDTPWTAVARWEQKIKEKVGGFGGVLLQHTAALLTWVFGLPQAVEQLPQRAVHAAIAIRQMVAAAQPTDRTPGPAIRLAAHLGMVLVDPQAPDPTAHLRPVGDTLALPVRLLGQARPGDIVVSPEVGRLVEGWVALEARALHRHAGSPEALKGTPWWTLGRGACGSRHLESVRAAPLSVGSGSRCSWRPCCGTSPRSMARRWVL